MFVEIGADEELSGDGYWHHWAHTVFDADADALREADRRAQEAAEAHGVHYDGWHIVRHPPYPPLTRSPSVADPD